MRTNARIDLNVGQASRLPSERASSSRKSNLSPAPPTGAGGTPALLCRRLGSEPRRVVQSCREALPINLPSESRSKLRAVQTLARSCRALPLREAFGVRPACRRFALSSSKRELLRQILLLPLTLAAALSLLSHTAFAQTWQTVDD